jgi:preprotein translocase subunit SecB
MTDADLANQARPSLSALGQYIKDLSFENPNGPNSLVPRENGPNIAINVNVTAKQIADTDFEVELLLEGKAGDGVDLMFRFELNYAGIFRVVNIPAENIQGVIMIECPRLLFPFARQIIADSVRNGGFPPLLIDPIDFTGLYQQKLSQMQGEPVGNA